MFVVLGEWPGRRNRSANSLRRRPSFVNIACPSMNARLRKIIRPFVPLPAMLLVALGAQSAYAQKIDQNANGLSDIWEQIYGATALDPNTDTDGDGVPNRLEALAGTDPLDPNSVPKITVSTYYSDHFAVTIPSQLGKLYQLQSIQPVGGGGWTNWTTESSLVS